MEKFCPLNVQNDDLYEIDRQILKCDCIPYSPLEIKTIRKPNSQIYIIIPREDTDISFLKCYHDKNFKVVKYADITRYTDSDVIRLGNWAPIALFSNWKFTTSSGNHLEVFSNAHLVSLLYKLITSVTDGDDMSIGFDRDRNRRRYEINNNKNSEDKYNVRSILKVDFGFMEHPEKATYGLGCKLTLTRNASISVLKEAGDIDKAKVVMSSIDWY